MQTPTTTAKTIFTAIALAASAALGSGCALIDGLTERMIDAGILLPSARRARSATGLSPDCIVQVEGAAGRGAGVVVQAGLVLTASHVCPGRTAQVLQPSRIPWGVAARYDAQVVWRSPSHDLALLSAPRAVAAVATPSGRPTAGAAWLIRPVRRDRMATGDVNQGVEILRAEVHDAVRYRLHEGATRPGDSGSPLIQAGRVVGVVRSATEFAPAMEVEGAALAALRPTAPVQVAALAVVER